MISKVIIAPKYIQETRTTDPGTWERNNPQLSTEVGVIYQIPENIIIEKLHIHQEGAIIAGTLFIMKYKLVRQKRDQYINLRVGRRHLAHTQQYFPINQLLFTRREPSSLRRNIKQVGMERGNLAINDPLLKG